MKGVPRRARGLSAVALVSTLLVASSRATPAPTDREIHERWRQRLPGEVERLRPAARERQRAAATAALRQRFERLRDLPAAERRQRLAELVASGRRDGASPLAGLPAPGRAAASSRAASSRAASSRAAASSRPAAAPFHSGGAAVCEPLPTNPILDPLALFEDEAGEEPPVADLSRYFLADFDGDGDLDLFVGDKYGYVRYLENVGTPAEPVFEERTGAASPTGALDLSEAEDDATDEPFGPSAPTLVDVDGDDDLDLFVGTGYGKGRVLFFENDGSGNLTRNDADNPLAGFVFGEGFATPHFADFDGDLDFDAFVGTKGVDVDGEIVGEVFYLRNEGDANNPIFVDRTDEPGTDPFAGVEFAPFTAPFLADVDGDDDLDAFVGNFLLTRFFRNTGGALVEEADAYANPLAGSLLFLPAPALADVDDDGDLDAFLGGGAGKITGGAFFFENGGDATSPAFLSTASHVELTDLDGDGDLDAIVGLKLLTALEVPDCECAAGGVGVGVFLNTGTPETPRWELQGGPDNPFSAFNATYDDLDAAPTVGDLDGDGELEAFVGGYYGYLEYLEFNPVSGQFEPGVHPLAGPFPGYSTDPHLADLDGDGELDLLVGYSDYDTYEPRVAVFLNPPGPDGLDFPPDFVIDLAATGGNTAQPTLADVDGDGDLDLLVGVGYDLYGFTFELQALLVENTGDAANPVFDGSSAQFVEAAQSDVGSPAAGDLNGDGLLDLVLGSPAGAEVFLTEAIGVTVDPPGPLTTTEVGGADTFTVVLDAAPAGTVVLDVASNDPGEGTAAPAQLTFGPGDWNVPQTVTVTGVDDPDADGPQPYDVALTVNPASTIPCVAQPTVPVVNLDDEAALLAATKEVTGGDLRAGGTVVYTIELTNVGALTQPDDPDDPELTDTLPAELTLLSAFLVDGPGAVTTSGATVRWDGALDPGETATIQVTAAIAGDAGGVEIANQAIALSDNDTDGDNESPLPSDDPGTPEPGDATAFAAAAEPFVADIPTLSEWGAALFAGLLSLLALFGLRRRG